MAQINLQTIVEVLRNLRDVDRNPHLEFRYADSSVRWEDFTDCHDGDLPAIDHGQKRNCRWSLSGQEGLHAHWLADRVRFHIDSQDPLRRPVQHMLFDTYCVAGFVMGALLGTAISRNPIGATIGGIVGGSIALVFHPPASSVWTLHRTMAGAWMPSRVAKQESNGLRRDLATYTGV